MRNKTLAVIAGATLVSSLSFGANAADLLLPPPPVVANDVPVYQPMSPFTGAYVGGTIGGVTSDDFDEDNSAFALGAQVGYNQQFGAFVVGAEIEALWLDDLDYSFGLDGGVTQDWEVTAKARAGFAFDRTMVYGTLGYSWTDFDDYGVTDVDGDVLGGLQWGLGVEHAITDSISARLEYAHTYYEDVGGYDIESQAVKAGLNYRF